MGGARLNLRGDSSRCYLPRPLRCHHQCSQHTFQTTTCPTPLPERTKPLIRCAANACPTRFVANLRAAAFPISIPVVTITRDVTSQADSGSLASRSTSRIALNHCFLGTTPKARLRIGRMPAGSAFTSKTSIAASSRSRSHSTCSSRLRSWMDSPSSSARRLIKADMTCFIVA